MKNILFVIMAMMVSLDVISQEICQQTYLEMNEEMYSHESYLCQATTSIKLLPGFSYNPNRGESMTLEIDRYSVFPPVEGYYGGATSLSNGVIGTLHGNFSVSNTGAAVYSIDINLPDAIGTMKPDLSLVYGSQGGNGIMGWAWELAGLSSITRTGQTQYHDGNITDVDFVNDRYLLDGQRLILVEGSTYGANNAKYKLEVDNMDKIVSYANNNSTEYFVIWKNDGTIWEYGVTEDSRVELKNDSEIILKWLLCKIYDRYGNAIVFNYDKDLDNGEAYIDNIQYTSNESSDVAPAYKISFVYDNNRSDVSCTYVAGNKLLNDRLLKNILVYNNSTGKMLYDYSIDYYTPGLYGSHQFMYYRVKSIGLSAGEDNINPTHIIWNAEKNHYPSADGNYLEYKLDKSMFSNVTFVGDFNGDGFSDVLLVPYKIQDAYSNDIEGEVYINNGDGSFQMTPMTTIPLSKQLEWIYVLDINGDGKDDIIPCEYNYDVQTVEDVETRIHFYIMKDDEFVKKASYTYDNIVLLTGKFLSNDDNGVVVIETFNKDKTIDYIRCVDDNIVKKVVGNTDDVNIEDATYMALDVTGDGVCELLLLKGDGYQLFKFDDMPICHFDLFSEGTTMTKDVYPFPNDYNGDGKTDLLYYQQSRSWQIAFSKGDGTFESINCSQNSMLRNVTLNHKDRYRYSLREMEKPSVTIRTADYDGDGTADVGVFRSMAGNYYLELGFKPYLKSDDECDFTYEKRYYMPLNYSHQTIYIGRFLAQENVSILSKLPREPYYTQEPCIVSLRPQSTYYSVERIVDGMGNIMGFSYDYLMHDKKDEFYMCFNYMTYNDIKKSSIPMRALKSDTIFGINGKPVINKYSYTNALIHTKGHGFMGFQKVVVRNYINGNIVSKKVSEFETVTMGPHCMSLPSTVKLYNGEHKLINDKYYSYKKYSCSLNDKVVMPLLEYDYEFVCNPDKQGELLKKIVVKREYVSDERSEVMYDNIVALNRMITGITNDINATVPEDCPYKEIKEFKYDNDLNDWIVNRPEMISCLKQGHGYDDIGNVTIYEYDDRIPYQVLKETKVPNYQCDISNSLVQISEYEYDKVGNIILQSSFSPSALCKKIVRFEYEAPYNYMYRTKTIDGLGREVKNTYDSNYGFLTSTHDYNGFTTYNDKDPFGINDVLVLPDGMVKMRSLRWIENNEYAPSDALYYSWEKSTGSSESLIFYHKSGIELRTVTFDVNGKAMYVDKKYDDFGNVVQESLPYYKDDDRLFVSNTYDEYNRLIEKRLPNGLVCSIAYDGNTIVTECITIDGKLQTKREVYNIMGWLTSNVDTGGNEILYEYYIDGLIKSASIGANTNSMISVTYDNARNRKTLCDPNYGLVTYQYDAYGKLRKLMNPNGGTIEFYYDILGRMKNRIVKDDKLKKNVATNWIYNESKGKNGMLEKVCSENHQIEYVYDDNLRLHATIEIIDGNEYKTLYAYDQANRVSSITYPSGVVVSKIYSNSGFEKEIYDAEDNFLLWKSIETMADGSISEYELGNGIMTKILYDSKTFLINRIVSFDKGDVIQDMIYDYDGYGNMKSRTKLKGFEFCEEFEYDEFDRLVSITMNGRKSSVMDYDYLGNIILKEKDGVNVLYSTRYSQNRPNAIQYAKTDDENMLLGFCRDMKYSAFDNLTLLMQADDFLKIDYGCDNDRVLMESYIDGVYCSRLYVGDCEMVTENSKNKSYTYIRGPMGVFAVCVIDDDGEKVYNYIHKDNLGSWNIVTNENAEIIQDVSFDAWGNIRDGNNWDAEAKEQSLFCDRGYTGHEHLLAFGLINMNGRIYDPMMSMMLSPDNNIQLPQASQNFNRYSYCINNPLKYNDPTGEWLESVAFGVVGGAVNLVLNAKNIDSFGEGALLFGVGFMKGFFAEYTLGQSWFLKVGVNTLMGSVTSGVNQMVSVGDGTFKFSGDDWNSIKTSAHYALGNGLVKNIMYTFITEPTDTEYGDSFFESCEYLELGHSITSLAAHGMGCWFSGQAFLPTMRFKDIGFDLKLLSIMAEKLILSYVEKSGFAEKAISERALEIKESVLSDIRSELPDYPDIEYLYELKGACIDKMRLYVIGDVFTLLPGEMLDVYPIPFMEEIIVFPFNFSLFKSLF